jgi:hypothetical protein
MTAAKKPAKKKAAPKLTFSSLKAGDKVTIDVSDGNGSYPKRVTGIVISSDNYNTYMYLDQSLDFGSTYGYVTTPVAGDFAREAYQYGLDMKSKRQLCINNPSNKNVKLISKDGALKPTIKEVPYKDCKPGDKIGFTVFDDAGKNKKYTGTVLSSSGYDVFVFADQPIPGNNYEGLETDYFDQWDDEYDLCYNLDLNPKLKRKFIIDRDGAVAFIESRTQGTPPRKPEKIKFGSLKKGDKVELLIDYGEKRVAHTATVLSANKSSADFYLDKAFCGENTESEYFDFEPELKDAAMSLGLNTKAKRFWSSYNGDCDLISMKNLSVEPADPVLPIKEAAQPVWLGLDETPKDVEVKFSDLKVGDKINVVIKYDGKDNKHTATVLSVGAVVDFYLDKSISSDGIQTSTLSKENSPELNAVAKNLGLSTKAKRWWSTYKNDPSTKIVSKIDSVAEQNDETPVDTATPIDLSLINKIKEVAEILEKIKFEIEEPVTLKDLKARDVVNFVSVNPFTKEETKLTGIMLNKSRMFVSKPFDFGSGNRSFALGDAHWTADELKLIDELGIDKNTKQFWATFEGDNTTRIVSRVSSNKFGVLDGISGDKEVYFKKLDGSFMSKEVSEMADKELFDSLNKLWAVPAVKKITYQQVRPGDKVVLNIHDSHTGKDAKVKAYVTRSNSESIDFLFEKEFSNTALASWSIKEHQREAAKSFGFDIGKKVGWHINEKTKYTSIESILPKSDLSFPLAPVPVPVPALEQDAIALGMLHPGDYIEFETTQDGKVYKEKGRVLFSGPGGIDIYCDRAFGYTYDPTHDEFIKDLGLDPTLNRQFTILTSHKHSKVTKVQSNMADKISYTKLKKGDKISVEFEDKGTITKRTATVLGIEGKSAVLYLDGGPYATSRGPLGQSWNPHDAGFEHVAKDMGFDPNMSCCWRYKDTSAYTKVTAILPTEIPYSSLKPGDIVDIEIIRKDKSELHSAKVIYMRGGTVPILAFDKKYVGVAGGSWSYAGQEKELENAAISFGIAKSDLLLFQALQNETFIRKVTKPKPIAPGTLRAGDKINATIKELNVDVEGTVFYADNSVAYIYLDKKDVAKVPKAFAPNGAVNTATIATVAALGLDVNAACAFKLSPSAGDTINRITGKSNVLLADNLAQGDRILVDVDGVQAHATVLQAKAPWVPLVMAFDKPLTTKEGKAVSGKLIASFQALAKKFGHTGDNIQGMNMDHRHKILKRIDTAPATDIPETKKPIEKKETKMTNQVTFLDRMKSDGEAAGYRVASTQFTKAIKAGIMLLFKDKGFDDSKLSVVKEILESEFGTAIVSTVLGYGLTYVPNLKDDPRVAKLAEEFRISGMATVGNEIMGVAVSYFLPAVTQAMAALPPLEVAAKTETKKTTKKRISAPAKNTPVVVDDTQEESVKAPTATA